MIVHEVAEDAYTCLARRGMLHSETEAVDHLRLAAGAVLDGRGREGIAEAWFVVAGEGALASGRSVAAGSLILRPAHTRDALTAATGLQLLILSVLPDELAGVLPPRSPEYAAEAIGDAAS